MIFRTALPLVGWWPLRCLPGLRSSAALLLLALGVSVGKLSAQTATPLGTFGGGTLANVSWIATDPAGNAVFASSFGAESVPRFDLAGNFQLRIGSAGTGDGQFRGTSGVAIRRSTGQVYVADLLANRIQRFSAFGIFQIKFGAAGTGSGQFGSPLGLAVNETNGQLYVCDENNHRIQRFDADGGFIGLWGSQGSGPGQFQRPFAVAVNAATGQVYVCDYGNRRIQRFSSAGEFELAWGTPGAGGGQFDEPVGVSVDAAGRVYVADSGNHCIQRFTADGVFQFAFGSFGNGPAQFASPFDASIADGVAYIADNNNGRVSRWRITEPEPAAAIPTLKAKGSTKISTAKSRVLLRGSATGATVIEFRVGKGRSRAVRGDLAAWQIPLRLAPGLTTVKIQASGPGGRSSVLTFRVKLRR